MGKYTDKLNINRFELDAYFATNEALSDMDYMRNAETGEYDVPALEWDGIFGKHWQRFGCEEDRDAALDRYDRRIAAWVIDFRNRKIVPDPLKIARRKMARKIQQAKTLGGQHPELLKLKNRMI